MRGSAGDGDQRAFAAALRGWEIRPVPGARILSERIGDENAFAMRTWSTALSAHWPAPAEVQAWRMLVVLDGEAEIQVGPRPVSVRHGDLVLSRRGALEVTSAAPTAVMTAAGPWSERIGAAFGASADDAAELRVLQPSGIAISTFAAIVNQGIAGDLRPGQKGFAAYWRAVEHSVAFLGKSGGSWIPEGLSPANAELYRRALSVMERHYPRAELSVAEIAEGAFASASSLFRAFGAAGTTPLAVLRRVRLAAVTELVELRGADIDDAVLARMTGFSSVPAMLTALDASRRTGARFRPATAASAHA